MNKINKTDEEWKTQLSDEQYRVTRKAGTEAPFSGEYEKFWDEGQYHCVCCGHALFGSESKFNAGCGWPSFHSELDEANIVQRPDSSLGMRRIELLCRFCDATLPYPSTAWPTPGHSMATSWAVPRAAVMSFGWISISLAINW
jgi:peptide-methionine (R)-S-oxide reductase